MRLRNLATLSIEQQLTDNINFDIAIEKFVNKKARKLTVQKIVVFISKIKMVLSFYYFSLYVIFAYIYLTVTYSV